MLRRLPQRSHRLDRELKSPCAWTGRHPAARPLTSPRAASTVTRAKRKASASTAAEGADETSHAVSERPNSHPGRDEELIHRINAATSLAMLADITQHLHHSHISARVSGSIAVQALKLLLLDWPDHDDTPAAPADSTSQPSSTEGNIIQPSTTTVEEDAAAAAQQANFQAAVAAAEAAVVAAQRAAAAAEALMTAAHEAAQAAEAAVSAANTLRDAPCTAAATATAIATSTSELAHTIASKVAELAAAVQATAVQVRATPSPPSASLREEPFPAAQHDITTQDFAAIESLLQQCLARFLADGLPEPSALHSGRVSGPSGSKQEVSRSHAGALSFTAVLVALAESQSRLPDATDRLHWTSVTRAELVGQGTSAQSWSAFINEVGKGRVSRKRLATDLLRSWELEGSGHPEGVDAAAGELTAVQKNKNMDDAAKQGRKVKVALDASVRQEQPQPSTPALDSMPAPDSAVAPPASDGSEASSGLGTSTQLPSSNAHPQSADSPAAPPQQASAGDGRRPWGHALRPKQRTATAKRSHEAQQPQRQSKDQAQQNQQEPKQATGTRWQAPEEPTKKRALLEQLFAYTGLADKMQAQGKEQQPELQGGVQEFMTLDDASLRSLSETVIEGVVRSTFVEKPMRSRDATAILQMRDMKPREPETLVEKLNILHDLDGHDNKAGIAIVNAFRRYFGEEAWLGVLTRACPGCPTWLSRATQDRADLCSRAASVPSLDDAVRLAAEVHEQQQAHDRKLLNGAADWKLYASFMTSSAASIERNAAKMSASALADAAAAIEERWKSDPMAPLPQAPEEYVQRARMQASDGEREVKRLESQIVFEDHVMRPFHLIPNRASYVLNEALHRRLSSMATDGLSSGSSGGFGADRQYILEQLPRWLLDLHFWPSPATRKLLVSTAGSAALLAAIPFPQPKTDGELAVLRFVSTIAAAGVLAPESHSMSPEDVSRWLRRAIRFEEVIGLVALLSAAVQAAMDEEGGEFSFNPFTDDLGRPLPRQPEVARAAFNALDGRLPSLLAAVDASSGDLSAVIEFSLTRVQRRLSVSTATQEPGKRSTGIDCQAAPDPDSLARRLLGCAVNSLQRVKPSEQPALLRRSLEVAAALLPECPEAFVQVLHQAPEHVTPSAGGDGETTQGAASKGRGGAFPGKRLEGIILEAVSKQLHLHRAGQSSGQAAETPDRQASQDTVATPLQLAAALVQLSLTRGGILLPLSAFEQVADEALQCGQNPLALQILTTLFSAGHRLLPPSATISSDLVRCIVRRAPSVSVDSTHLSLSSLLNAASPLGTHHRSLLLQGLLAVSAQERSSAWASAAAAEALSDCFTPTLVSDLITAFIQPAVSEGADNTINHKTTTPEHSSDQGIRAAVRAFQALLQSPGGSAAEKVLSMTQPARQAMATWLLQQGAVGSAGPGAMDTPTPAIGSHSLILALDLCPTAAVARQLLLHPTARLSAADLRHVVALAAEKQWKGLGGAALQCLRTLSTPEQRAVLQEGRTILTLACLLVGDARTETQSVTEQPSSLSLMLGLLEESVMGAAEGAGKAVPEGAARVPLGRAEWQQLLVAVLDLSDATSNQEAADAADAIVQMVQAAAPLDPSVPRGRADTLQHSGAALIATRMWLVQECLLAKGSLRRPASLALAQRLLQDLSSQGWGLTGEHQTTQQSIKLGMDLLLWMSSKKAVRGGVSGTHTHSLPWLPALVSDLSVHLAAADASWATGLAGDAQSLVLVSQACADHAARSPLVELLVAAVANKNVKAKVPMELVGRAVEAAAALHLWREGSMLLEHLGVDLKSWRSQQGATRCRETMGQLSTAQVQAAVSILVQDAPSYAIEGPMNNAKALAAVCSYCEEELLQADSCEVQSSAGDHTSALSLLLSVRGAAAAAASEYVTELSGKAADSLPQELDPDWHCREAERAVRQQLPAVKAGGGAQPSPSVSADTLVQLLGVFDAARRPLHALHLGVEVAQGVLAVTPSPSGADGTRVVAASMGVCTRCGYSKGSVVLLEELLTARGEVTDTQVMAQAMGAVSCAGEPEGDELAQRIVVAIGDDGYFAMEEGASSAGSDSSSGVVDPGSSEGLCVRADPVWLKERRALTMQQRQESWGLP